MRKPDPATVEQSRRALIDFIARNHNGYSVRDLIAALKQWYQVKKLNETQRYLGAVKYYWYLYQKTCTERLIRLMACSQHGITDIASYRGFVVGVDNGSQDENGNSILDYYYRITNIRDNNRMYQVSGNTAKNLYTYFTNVKEFEKKLDGEYASINSNLSRIADALQKINFKTYVSMKNIKEGELTTELEYTTSAAENGFWQLDAGILDAYNRAVVTADGPRIGSISRNSRKTAFEYGAEFTRLVKPGGSKITFYFDLKRNITNIYEPGNADYRLFYDNNGRVSEEIGPDGIVNKYNYDVLGNILSNRKGDRLTAYEYGNEMARFFGKPSVITYPDGKMEKIDYDQYADIKNHTITYNGQTVTMESNVRKDNYDRSYEITHFDRYGYQTKYLYNQDGRIARITRTDNSVTRYETDKRGNIIRETRHDNTEITRAYRFDGYLTNEIYDYSKTPYNNKISNIIRQYGYDRFGNITWEKNAGILVLSNTYDLSIGRLKSQILPDGTSAQFTYDFNGNMVLEKDSDNKWIWHAYDAMDRELTNITSDGYTNVWEYYPDGQVKRHAVYGRGTTGLPAEYNTPVRDQSFVYNEYGQLYRTTNNLDGSLITCLYSGNGIISSKSLNRGSEEYKEDYLYDIKGRMTNTRVMGKSGTFTLKQVVYDDSGHKATEIDQFGIPVEKYFNFRGQVTNETIWVINSYGRDAEKIVNAYEYDPEGNLIKRIYPDDSEVSLYYTDGKLIWETGRSTNKNSTLRKYYTYNNRGLLTCSTDLLNNNTKYDYDNRGMLITMTDPLGNTQSFNYDAAGNRIEIRHGNMGPVKYKYGRNGKIIETVYPDGMAVTYGYDALGNQTYTRGGAGWSISAYNDGRLVYEKTAAGLTALYSYDIAGNKKSERQGGGRNWAYEYDQHNRLTARILPDDTRETMDYTFENGLITVMKRYGGNVSREIFNNLMSPLLRTVYDDQVTADTAYGYDKAQKVIMVSNLRGLEFQVYDDAGRVLEITNRMGYVLKNTYDIRGYKIGIIDFNGGRTSYVYDEAGRLIRVTNALGGAESYGYDAAGNRIRTVRGLEETSAQYNERGDILRDVNAQGGVTTYTYNNAGLLANITGPDGNAVSYQYDGAGRLIKKQQGGFTWQYGYTEYGETNTVVYPDGGLQKFDYDKLGRLKWDTYGSRTNAYSYNSEGYLTRIDSFTGLIEERQYSKAGYLKSTIIKNQDGEERTAAAHYDPDGLTRQTVDHKGMKTDCLYDAMGVMTQKTVTAGNKSRTEYLNWHYENSAGTSITVKESWINAGGIELNKTRQVLNAQGLLTEIWKTDDSGKYYLAAFYQYDRFGKLEKESLVLNEAESAETLYEYNPNGTLRQKTLPNGLKVVFSYDNMGRITEKTETDGISERKTIYRYDALGRLKETIDPIGLTRRTYADFRGSPVVTTETPRGLTVSNVYDIYGQKLLEMSMADGKVSAALFVYDQNGRLEAATNALGGYTLYRYDAWGRKTAEETAVAVTFFDYDKRDNVTNTVKLEKVDRQKAQSAMIYDDWGQIVKAYLPDGGFEEAFYDEAGRKKKTTDPYGYETEYIYNPRGLLGFEKTTTPDGVLETGYVYDTAGRVLKKTVNAREWNYEYNKTGQVIKTSQRVNGRSLITESAYNAWGENILIKAPDGAKTTIEYDAAGRLKRILAPDGLDTVMTYNDAQRTMKTVKRGGGLEAATTTLTDGFGRVIEKTDELGVKETFAYDAAGNVINATDKSGARTVYRYDRYGRMLAAIDQKGMLSNVYDGFDRVIENVDREGNSTKSLYDSAGRVTQKTDMQTNRTKASYTITVYNGKKLLKTVTTDPLNALKTEYTYAGRTYAVIDPLGNTTAYSYTPFGELKETRDPKGAAARFEYDARGLLIKKTTALGFATSYEYDDNGRQVKETNPLEWITTLYDAAGRITGKTYRDGNRKTFTYDGLGRLKTAADNNSRYRYSYNAAGLLTNRMDELNGETQEMEYDAAGRRIKFKTGDKTTLTRYDNAGNMTNQTVTALVNGQNIKVFSISQSYSPMGRLLQKTVSTGLSVNYAYDNLYRLIMISNRTNNAVLSVFTYAYDASGNRLSETVEQDGKTALSEYRYDQMGQLTEALYPQDTNNYKPYERFTYDAAGNRTRKTDIKGTTTYTYDSDNRLLAEQTPTNSVRCTYDTAGRLIRKETGNVIETFIYDSRDLMTRYIKSDKGAISTTDYTYDCGNMRVGKKGKGALADEITRYTYDGQNILTEGGTYYVSGSTVNSYAGFIGSLTAAAYVTDAIGSIRAELYNNKTTIYNYSAFGEILNGPTTAAGTGSKTGLGFTGHYADGESGLYYARARYYSPASGRFITRDSIDDTSPQGLNYYEYGLNNPLTYTDPLGLMAVDPDYQNRFNNYARNEYNNFVMNQVMTSTFNYGAAVRGEMGIWTYNAFGYKNYTDFVNITDIAKDFYKQSLSKFSDFKLKQMQFNDQQIEKNIAGRAGLFSQIDRMNDPALLKMLGMEAGNAAKDKLYLQGQLYGAYAAGGQAGLDSYMGTAGAGFDNRLTSLYNYRDRLITATDEVFRQVHPGRVLQPGDKDGIREWNQVRVMVLNRDKAGLEAYMTVQRSATFNAAIQAQPLSQVYGAYRGINEQQGMYNRQLGESYAASHPDPVEYFSRLGLKPDPLAQVIPGAGMNTVNANNMVAYNPELIAYYQNTRFAQLGNMLLTTGLAAGVTAASIAFPVFGAIVMTAGGVASGVDLINAMSAPISNDLGLRIAGDVVGLAFGYAGLKYLFNSGIFQAVGRLAFDTRMYARAGGSADRIIAESRLGGTSGVYKKFSVGHYDEIQGKVKGLDAHHVGQKAAMKKFIPDYDMDTAPAILVPEMGHTYSDPIFGIVSRKTSGFANARQVIARDLWELRRVYPDIPNSQLQKLIQMNKEMYPILKFK